MPSGSVSITGPEGFPGISGQRRNTPGMTTDRSACFLNHGLARIPDVSTRR